MIVWIIYSKSKIHGVYTDESIAYNVLNFLTNKGGYINGIPKRFYYIESLELDKAPNGMVFLD